MIDTTKIEDEASIYLDTPEWRAWVKAIREASGPRRLSIHTQRPEALLGPSKSGKSVTARDNDNE